MTIFNVYRRELDDANPPVAIATGLSSTSHLDESIDAGKTYLYSVGAVKDGFEKISDEVTVFTGIEKYRHINIYVTAINGGDKLVLQEVEIASSLNGADITFPTMGTNQSSQWNGMVASKLVNRDYDNYWGMVWESDGSLPQWIHFDFGVEVSVAEVRIFPQNWGAGVNRSPSELVIRGAKEDGIWEDIGVYSNVVGWVQGKATVFNVLDGTFEYQQ